MERSAWPKNLSSSRKRAIQELLHGQNPTKKLGDLFDAHSQTGNNTGQSLFGEDLIANALRSFSNTLSQSSSAESYEVLQVPTNACVMSEVSEESESIHTPVPRHLLMRKQKKMEDLIGELGQLQQANGQLAASITAAVQNYAEVQSVNTVLRAQAMELSDRLRSLNSVLEIVQVVSGLAVHIPEIPDPLMKPWQFSCPINPSWHLKTRLSTDVSFAVEF